MHGDIAIRHATMGLTELGDLRYREDLRTFGFMALCAASLVAQWHLRDMRTESWACFCSLLLLSTFQVFQGGVSVVRCRQPCHRLPASAHLPVSSHSTTRRTARPSSPRA